MPRRKLTLGRRLVRSALGQSLRRRADAIRETQEGYDCFGANAEGSELALAVTRPMYERYFRVKSYGAENIPAEGAAIVAVNHSGTLPFDAFMLHADILRHTSRRPRTVIDRFVPRLPFFGTLVSRAGGINGTRRNVEHVLRTGQLLVVFPEGTIGIGKKFSERYRITAWRAGHAELALAFRAPVVPTAIVGAEEQMPIVARLDGVKVFGAPYLPVPATPFPLPVRYHIRFGEPVALHERLDGDPPRPGSHRRSGGHHQRARSSPDRRGPRGTNRSVPVSRYLLTGATTPIGESLIRALLSYEDTEHILAVGAEPIRPATVEIDGRVRYQRIDLTRERNLRSLLFGRCRERAITTVVDMAAHRSVHSTGTRARALNVLSTRRLLSLAEDHPTIRRFVYRSYAEVHDVSEALPALIDEAHPLNLSPRAPQWVRDRVEADLTVCTRMGMSDLSIAVLRCAECLAPRVGSQIHDYLKSRVCFRPLGYDPVFNLISEQDVGRALALAARSDAQGIFTIPGASTLPLSEIVRRSGRTQLPIPGPLMSPVYGARRAVLRSDFDYAMNRGRLHFNVVLDGSRAKNILGYEPRVPPLFARD